MKPVSASITFQQNGVSRTLDLLSEEGNDILSFEASCEEDRFRILLTPNKAIQISELIVTYPYEFDKKDYIFMNGYQSWTVCKEYSIDTTNVAVEQMAKLIRHKKTDRSGDREFTTYPKQNRWLHGVSYGYIRKEKLFRFFGSLNEEQGFTFFDIDTDKGSLTVRKDLSRKYFDSAFSALDIWFREGTEDEVFDGYFEKLGIAPREARPVTGYTTWYRHQSDITEKKIMRDIADVSEAAARYPCRIFCLDEGYENAIGDWLTPKKNAFPHGIYPVSKKILSSGMQSAVWIAPFICDKHSRVYKNHSEWLLRDDAGKPVPACTSWHDCYCLDSANPAFRRHLKNVLLTMRDDWGVSVFKFDFLYAACMLPSTTQTRAERMYDAIRFLKECVGDCITIGCGVPLMAAAGNMDYCQVSCDLSAEWFPPLAQASREQNSTYRALVDLIRHRQLAGRAFALFTNVLPINNPHFLFSKERRFLLGRAMGLCQGMILTSDDLTTYNAEDTVVWNTIHALRQATVKSVYTKDRELIVEYELYLQPQKLKIPLLE